MKNCETVGSAVRSNTSAATRATADFNLLDLKNVILCPNQAQIRDKIRFQQNVYKLRLMAKSLTLVKIPDRILYGTDGVTQVSVLDTTISGVDSGRLDGDKLLSLKVFNVLRNGVSAHVNRFAYGLVARITLVEHW